MRGEVDQSVGIKVRPINCVRRRIVKMLEPILLLFCFLYGSTLLASIAEEQCGPAMGYVVFTLCSILSIGLLVFGE